MSSGSILFIDDESSWRSRITRLLSAAGYQADAVAELPEAEDRLKQRSYDLLLIDRKFDQDYRRGLEIVRELKARHPDQEIILLTSHIDLDAVGDVLGNDAHAAIQKGDSRRLLNEVRLVALKKRMGLARFRKPVIKTVLYSPALETLREDLSILDAPREVFLNLVALAGMLDAAGALSGSAFHQLLKGSRIGADLEHAEALDDATLQTLAEMAPQVTAALSPAEKAATFGAKGALVAERGEAIRSLLVRALLAGKADALTDQDRIVLFQRLLDATAGVTPLGPQLAARSLLNSLTDPALVPLNTPCLVRLHAGKLLEPLEAIVEQVRSHDPAAASTPEFQAVAHLVKAQHYYSRVCAVERTLDDYAGWLRTYADELVPLLVTVRHLSALAASFPGLDKAIGSCQVLCSRLNDRFVNLVCDPRQGYTAWVAGEPPGSRPMMTPDVLRQAVLPAVNLFKTVYLIIFDGMSLLSWHRTRERFLRPIFDFVTDDPVMAVLPTATRYARSAIFAGKFPRFYMEGSGTGGLNERRLLNDALRELGAGLSVSERDFMKFEPRHDRAEDQAKRRELDALIGSAARLKALIFDPHDKVTHIAPGFVDDFSELFYEVSIHPVLVRLSQQPETAVVIAVDHGFCEIRELKAVRGIFAGGQVRDSDTHYDPQNEERRGHFGKRYIDLGNRQFNPRYLTSWLRFADSPARWALPDSGGYLFAVGSCGFGLDAGATRMFAHGGISLEEMIVPVAVLASRRA